MLFVHLCNAVVTLVAQRVFKADVGSRAARHLRRVLQPSGAPARSERKERNRERLQREAPGHRPVPRGGRPGKPPTPPFLGLPVLGSAHVYFRPIV